MPTHKLPYYWLTLHLRRHTGRWEDLTRKSFDSTTTHDKFLAPFVLIFLQNVLISAPFRPPAPKNRANTFQEVRHKYWQATRSSRAALDAPSSREVDHRLPTSFGSSRAMAPRKSWSEPTWSLYVFMQNVAPLAGPAVILRVSEKESSTSDADGVLSELTLELVSSPRPHIIPTDRLSIVTGTNYHTRPVSRRHGNGPGPTLALGLQWTSPAHAYRSGVAHRQHD
ncbi:hypothetical protein FB451DRAFT_267288 [Mycena latifolia]|nr:hypothetical protein FB451DRAFT_267288 [Mycena latifolia]